ncbi:hypothetical protein T492DRAFT_1152123 [Pavlovales sp. CCMP2436]|nr:hypothetical protein T492DRAFT_1152123 [Pavlovales sp. CCMP2436]
MAVLSVPIPVPCAEFMKFIAEHAPPSYLVAVEALDPLARFVKVALRAQRAAAAPAADGDDEVDEVTVLPTDAQITRTVTNFVSRIALSTNRLDGPSPQVAASGHVRGEMFVRAPPSKELREAQKVQAVLRWFRWFRYLEETSGLVLMDPPKPEVVRTLRLLLTSGSFVPIDPLEHGRIGEPVLARDPPGVGEALALVELIFIAYAIAGVPVCPRLRCLRVRTEGKLERQGPGIDFLFASSECLAQPEGASRVVRRGDPLITYNEAEKARRLFYARAVPAARESATALMGSLRGLLSVVTKALREGRSFGDGVDLCDRTSEWVQHGSRGLAPKEAAAPAQKVPVSPSVEKVAQIALPCVEWNASHCPHTSSQCPYMHNKCLACGGGHRQGNPRCPALARPRPAWQAPPRERERAVRARLSVVAVMAGAARRHEAAALWRRSTASVCTGGCGASGCFLADRGGCGHGGRVGTAVASRPWAAPWWRLVVLWSLVSALARAGSLSGRFCGVFDVWFDAGFRVERMFAALR